MAKYPSVSPSVTRRLPRYYRFLEELLRKDVERISSREFAEIIGLTASQIRQDLNCFGGFGQQGYGYNVAALHAEISRILHINREMPLVMLGAGNLGIAIARHMEFEKRGFKLLGIFDANPLLIGKRIRDWEVLDIAELERFCNLHKPMTAILCIPKDAAAETTKRLYDCGVRGFWNFSHFDIALEYGDKVVVENVHLEDSLMTLSFNINELLDSEKRISG